VRFILGDEANLTLPKLVAFVKAKIDFEAGAELPYETMEGIRSVYHPDKTSADVLALTKKQLTTAQKLAMQKKADQANLKVDFDPNAYDPVRLYLYAFERGMDDRIAAALDAKGEEAAEQLPVRFGHVGVVVDASASMQGSDAQPLRPIATALALRDMLRGASDRATVVYAGGTLDQDGADRIVRPSGDTSIAHALLELVESEPEAVFVLSDGYENAPAGRFDEVVRGLAKIGVKTPIHQLSPVMAAESGGVRALSERVLALPVLAPKALPIAMVKTLLVSSPEAGVKALLNRAQKAITAGKED
jgi:hypothetical protein